MAVNLCKSDRGVSFLAFCMFLTHGSERRIIVQRNVSENKMPGLSAGHDA
jgi:hypothetical protein